MRAIQLTPVRLWLFLAVLLTTGAIGGYLVSQQPLRLGANDPQIQMAEDGAAALEGGQPVAQLVPVAAIDVARSLAPFVIVLDDAGAPIASSGRLDGRIPTPPAGVLTTVRAAGEERVTWAPRSGVRLASVVRRVQGSTPGFIVVARSLRETEERIGTMSRLIAFSWCVGMLGATLAVVLLAWMSPTPERLPNAGSAS